MTAPLPDSPLPDSKAPDETAGGSESPDDSASTVKQAGTTADGAKATPRAPRARTTKKSATAAKAETAKSAAAKTAAVKARTTQTAAQKATAKATAARKAAVRTAATKAATTKAAEAKAQEKAHEIGEEAAKVAAVKAKVTARTEEEPSTPAVKTSRRPAAKAKTPAKTPARLADTVPDTSATKTDAVPTVRDEPVPTVLAEEVTAPVPAEEESASQKPTSEEPAPHKATEGTKAKAPAKTPAKKRAPAKRTTSTPPAPKRPLVRAENVSAVAEVSAPVVPEAGVRDIDMTASASATAPAAVDEEPDDTAKDDVEESVSVDSSALAEREETETEEYALVIRDLVKVFGGHRAVDGISLTVPAGSFYGIVGPNGAGKTTTLSIVAGLLRADEGEVHVCGIDQRKDPRGAKKAMGVLPDRLRTFDRLTGRQLLHYYGLLRGLSADIVEKRTADLARAFDLTGALGRVVSDYSAGMTKKIMLAGAMIHSPRVLVLDEPFESVDPVSSGVILDILGAYVAHGGTVILSSHGMDMVQRVCSRIAIIVDGEVLAEGTVDDVRAGQTLEQRFVELSGGTSEVEGLEWLHAFSD